MATYEEIHGKRVDVFDDDPTIDSSYEGQVWYNSNLQVHLKSVVSFASWTSSTNAQANLLLWRFWNSNCQLNFWLDMVISHSYRNTNRI